MRRLSLLAAFALFLLAAYGETARAADGPIPIILDTDIGTDVDDAYALVLSARSPRLDLRAVTTLHGKVEVRSAIARKLLDLMGRRDVPVASGLSVSRAWGGWEGKGLLEPGETVPGVSPKPAHELMHDVLTQSREKVVIVPVGGLSNVAELLRKHPADKDRIERLVVMGGCVRPIVIQGKTFPERSEVNLHYDPEASAAVLRSGLPVTLMPAEVTYHTKLYEDDFARIRRAETPLARAVAAMTQVWSPGMKKVMANAGAGTYYDDCAAMLHDPAAVYLLVDPGSVRTERVRIRVEVGPGTIRTVPDARGPVEVEVATRVDTRALSRAVTDAVLK
jgi:inosine-uridine nucleoside N-ribohydrolase